MKQDKPVKRNKRKANPDWKEPERPVVDKATPRTFANEFGGTTYQLLTPKPKLPEAGPELEPIVHNTIKIRRNDKCWCGSGVKFKRCHQGKSMAEEKVDGAA